MPELRYGVLGALEVHVDGHPREIPAGRQRAVLACLLAHRGRPVPAAALVEAAWGEELPEDPARALRTVLSRLRAHLGQEAIRLDPAGYRLTRAPTDAEEFLDLVERARTAEPAVAGDLLGRALALWRGPAYGEYADTPLISTVAEHLDRLRRDTIEARASALVETGQPADAVAGLEELLAEQPFRESTVELLVRALYHAGRQTEALDRLRAYRALLGEELGLDPSPALTELEGHILGHGLAAPRTRTAGPPAWLDTSTAFIGREDDLAELVAAVADNQVTVVTGPGGVGKSRLAAESLAVLHDRLGLPISVVELAGVPRGGARAALAEGLGLRGDADADTDALVEFLTAVPHLLVLDNCEHLLDELAPLVATIARRCRDVRVLGTSRHRLGVPTELVLPLTPLRLPDPGATVGSQESTASVRMLGDRVRRLRPSFAVTPDNAAEVSELCRRCDGLPLALELAASRVATTGVGEVLARLPEDLSSSGLSGVVAWSYRLLGEPERWLLQCLSVCAGDLGAASLAGLMRHVDNGAEVGPTLGELVESSLVVRHEVGAGPGADRFRLLEMVRTFAARQLQESGRAEEVRTAHAHWVAELVTDVQTDWARVDGAELSARLARCSAEVSTALRWALGAGEVALASRITHALARCWHWTPSPAVRDLMLEVAEHGLRHPGPGVAAGVASGAFVAGERGEVGRGVELATAALEASHDPAVRATAQLALAVAAMYSGDIPESVSRFRAVAADPGLTGEANSSMALLACYADDLDTAREHAEVALAAGAVGSDHTLAFARYAAGEVEARTDPDAGAVLLRQAAEEADRIDAEQVGRVARIALFALLVRGGERGEAVTLGLRLVSDLRRLAAWNQIWTLLRVLAELLADSGRWSDAAFLLGAAAGASGAPPPMGADIERYAELRADLSRHLGARVTEQIEALAAATPRTAVLSRAEHLLESHPARL
ncbi:winged helix-turn-helix domain-containing protein [Ornithinimicrobium sp. F0845]|uniref:BTAD domain-containing putative transcriptional regulator n=1 Tax=Ornithinimicrobium sp. F0845 TaxID=2926412 RepID=UPI001FF4F537|nr:BTAD domain-containing putative transcriptional regulator [Ornithinimicrobium sp. F0845]MCK0112622.1 winged helix-turn-helix domain-containing protein [Ornithinimicrobium sp. F0845]